MRKYSLVHLAALLLAAAGTILFAWQAGPSKGQDVQRTMAVPGNQAVTNAGVTLGASDSVTVSATGTVFFSGGAQPSGVGPGGWPRNTYGNSWPDDYHSCEDPIPSAAHASLIADVNGNKFLVGPSKTFSGKAGLLYFGINDCTFSAPYHNTGSFSVTFTVRRSAVPHK